MINDSNVYKIENLETKSSWVGKWISCSGIPCRSENGGMQLHASMRMNSVNIKVTGKVLPDGSIYIIE